MSFIALRFDAAEWTTLCGGYRVPYDPRNALLALEREQDVDGAWNELWNELHHQGDVGDASYAAVPHLVRIHAARGVPDSNTYAMAALIEECRQVSQNPNLPKQLEESYRAALRQLSEIGLTELRQAEDLDLISNIIALIAIEKGLPMLGKLAMHFGEGERKAILERLGRSDFRSC